MKRVLQHRADQYAYTECEYHQQGNAGIAVTVFLDKISHAVEKYQECDEADPARTEGGIKIEVHAGGKYRTCHRRDKGQPEQAVSFLQNGVFRNCMRGVVVNVVLHGICS